MSPRVNSRFIAVSFHFADYLDWAEVQRNEHKLIFCEHRNYFSPFYMLY
jgi:hypothetical protein